ncbi:MAG TPA: hypothetical protein VJB14_11230 [Planctomycetota bacterium]|nr:hypothetical protein [Planctomycetota bacterium]
MMRLWIWLALSSLLPALSPDDDQVLRLAQDYLAGRADPKKALDLFNEKGAVERLFSEGKLSKETDWPKLRDLKLDALRQLNETFMRSTARRGNPQNAVTRMDHMGSSGTVSDYTPGSDADLRPNRMYHGIENDVNRIAREIGIKDLGAWKINILGRTGYGSVDDFLKAMRNPEKYPLEGALRFLDYNHWKSNVADVLQPDGSFRSKVPMTEILPDTPKPTAMDATDYMAEMFTRATEDFHKMSKVTDFSGAEAMKDYRQAAKDLYKYAGTRAVGEACAYAGLEITPEMRAIMERAKLVKADPKGQLGDDPAAIRKEAEKLLELTRSLLDRSIERRAFEIAKQQAGLPETLSRDTLDSFVEVSKSKLRLAHDIVRGGPEVERMVREHLMRQDATGKLWGDVDALRRYTLEEMNRTMNPEKLADHQKRVRSFLERMLEKLGREGGAVPEGANPNGRRVEHRKTRSRIPALETENRGAAKLVEPAAKRLNDRLAPAIDDSPGNGKTWLQSIPELLREMREIRAPQLQETLEGKLRDLEVQLSRERLQGIVKSLMEFERSQVLHALKAQWKSLSLSDQTLLVRGRSLMRSLVEVRSGKEAIHKLFTAMLIWDIAWAAYEGGWDGFLLAVGGAAEAIFEWEAVTLLFSTVAPALLEKAGLSTLAAASVGIAELIPTFMMLQIASALVVKGMEKAVDWLVWDPIHDDNLARFYDFHAKGGGDVKGQGFFDIGREAYGLTPQSLFKGNEKRKGYATPEALLTAIRKHRSDLLAETKNVAQLGPQGLKLWRSVEDKALRDWGADAARTMQALKEQFQTLLGSERKEDIDELVLGARTPASPCAADIVHAAAQFEKRGDGTWRAQVRAKILVAGIPGADARLKVVHRIRGTELAREGSLDGYFSEADVEPARLLRIEKDQVEFDLDQAGVFIDDITVVDGQGQVLAQTAFELGVGYSGEIKELSVEVAREERGPAVRELRAAERAWIRVADRLEGFEAVATKSLSAWLEDSGGRRVEGTSVASAPARAATPVALSLSIPESVPPGEYRVRVVERIWKIEREETVAVSIGAPKARWTEVRCTVSAEADGTPPARRFLRGDFVYFSAHVNGKFVPPGTTAEVRWTVRRPTRGPVAIAPVSFPVQEGANSFTRPEPARIGLAAEPGAWGVTAVLAVGGETFTAQTSFEVSRATVRIDRFYATYRMDRESPSPAFAPGETVWARAHYTLLGAAESEQKVLITWRSSRNGGAMQEISRSTVPMPAGEQIALHAIPVPKQGALGRYRLEVSIQAERQEPVVASLAYEVKKPIEFTDPPLIVGVNKDATASYDPWRLGEIVHLVLRYRVNVANGQKTHVELETLGPEGRVAALSTQTEEKNAAINSWTTRSGPRALANDLKEGEYVVTGTVHWGEERIQTRAAFHIRHPARITNLSILEHKDSKVLKTRFKPGEPFGVYIGYSLQHLRENEKAKITLHMYSRGSEVSLWSQTWGPFDAKEGAVSLRAGGTLHREQQEGYYVFEAKVELGGFHTWERREFRVGVLPEIEITSPGNGSGTKARVISVTGTIADLKLTRARIALNGEWKDLAVANGRFTEKMVLKPGRNTVTVHAKNSLGEDTQSVTVHADIPATVLKVVLDWSTPKADVDLWVIDPEKVTTYYSNSHPSPDRSLDIDDKDGFGPETYTIFKPLRGEYTVIVKYYSAHGDGPTNTRVRWTAWENTIHEQRGENGGGLQRAAGNEEKPGASYRFTIRVP